MSVENTTTTSKPRVNITQNETTPKSKPKNEPTNFLYLPREVRQQILLENYSSSKLNRWGHFSKFHRDWVASMRQADSRITEDAEYVAKLVDYVWEVEILDMCKRMLDNFPVEVGP